MGQLNVGDTIEKVHVYTLKKRVKLINDKVDWAARGRLKWPTRQRTTELPHQNGVHIIMASSYS